MKYQLFREEDQALLIEDDDPEVVTAMVLEYVQGRGYLLSMIEDPDTGNIVWTVSQPQ
jgi:hypothetical protein